MFLCVIGRNASCHATWTEIFLTNINCLGNGIKVWGRVHRVMKLVVLLGKMSENLKQLKNLFDSNRIFTQNSISAYWSWHNKKIKLLSKFSKLLIIKSFNASYFHHMKMQLQHSERKSLITKHDKMRLLALERNIIDYVTFSHTVGVYSVYMRDFYYWIELNTVYFTVLMVVVVHVSRIQMNW